MEHFQQFSALQHDISVRAWFRKKLDYQPKPFWFAGHLPNRTPGRTRNIFVDRIDGWADAHPTLDGAPPDCSGRAKIRNAGFFGSKTTPPGQAVHAFTRTNLDAFVPLFAGNRAEWLVQA